MTVAREVPTAESARDDWGTETLSISDSDAAFILGKGEPNRRWTCTLT